ncbi:hypothetical protein ACHQM5_004477 [Ranunculus cassubicifolius]
MASQTIENHRDNAEVYYGDVCKSKSLELLAQIDLPNGLLPLEDISEVGYNRETGFVWLKQKKTTTHVFKTIGKHVSYGTEITAFVEKHKMKKLTGVKTKEILIWVTIGDIYIEANDEKKIAFKNPQTGISRSFPVTAFLVADDQKKGEN